jgi:hypothetical protein
MYKFNALALLSLGLLCVSSVYAKGGVVGIGGGGGKCSLCPPCMVCNPLVGCQYSNFVSCVTPTNKKGTCLNGVCDTTIPTPPPSPSPCKTYVLTNTVPTLVNKINGIDCTPFGSLMKYMCYHGVCTPFVDGLDKLGNNVGCKLIKDGTFCDTNGVLTDGETCMKDVCTMPPNAYNLCPM